jgi:hypothetical protein
MLIIKAFARRHGAYFDSEHINLQNFLTVSFMALRGFVANRIG